MKKYSNKYSSKFKNLYKSKQILWIYKTLIVFFAVLVFFLSLKSFSRIVSTTAPDFSLLWISTKDLIYNKNPYTNPNLFTLNAYPPIAFMLYIPLALLNYSSAQFIFTIFNYISVLGLIYISFKILNIKMNIFKLLIFITLSFLSFPVKFSLGMGQINMLAFLFVLLSYYYYKKDKDNISGFLMGIACLFKASLAFILIFYVIKRKWKIVIYSILVSIIATLLLILFFGADSLLYWFLEVLPKLTGVLGREVYYNQGLIGFISRLTLNLNVRAFLYYLTSLVLVIITSIQTIKKTNNEDIQFSLFTITLLFIDIISWQHHFVWLIFSFALLVKYLLKNKSIWHWCLIFLAYLLLSWNFKNPNMYLDFPKSLILSNTFYGAMIIYYLSLTYLSKKN